LKGDSHKTVFSASFFQDTFKCFSKIGHLESLKRHKITKCKVNQPKVSLVSR